jgi:hypothetical protein
MFYFAVLIACIIARTQCSCPAPCSKTVSIPSLYNLLSSENFFSHIMLLRNATKISFKIVQLMLIVVATIWYAHLAGFQHSIYAFRNHIVCIQCLFFVFVFFSLSSFWFKLNWIKTAHPIAIVQVTCSASTSRIHTIQTWQFVCVSVLVSEFWCFCLIYDVNLLLQ